MRCSFVLVVLAFGACNAVFEFRSYVPDFLKARAAGPIWNCTEGPCGPGNDQCGEPFGRDSPQYHVRDLSCGENDPNFPFFDPNHNLYHLMYQDHLCEYQNGYGGGPIIGHAVSADLVHWAHLPVSLWNDKWYDMYAVYTGSATVVNGLPVLVYPGLCVPKLGHNCTTGTTFDIALPANISDPFLTNWTKPSYNPIVQNVQRDPSTAWQTEAGEWRFTNFEGRIYSSWDFVVWNDVGPLFEQAECPDMFPLPAVCPTCDLPPNASLPNFVHKDSHSGDWYQLGTYLSGAENSTGTWTATPGVTFDEWPVDYSAGSGGYYASKSFWDPVKQRRIIWGWAQVAPASTQTLPREVTYDPRIQRLLFNPIDELKQLRETQLAKFANVKLMANESFWLGNWENQVGNQSEVHVTFAIPAGPAAFGITVMNGHIEGKSQNASAGVEVVFQPASSSAAAPIARVNVMPSPPVELTYFMPGMDLPGDDYKVTNVNYTDPKRCQAACTLDHKCAAYTYVVRPPLYASCCLKSGVPTYNPNPSCTSGVKHPQPTPPESAELPLLATDTSIDIRVFVDNTFIEVFVAGGRLTFTANLIVPANSQNGMTVYTNSTIAVQKAEAWSIGQIWIDKEEVLAQRGNRS
eukprot:TRINITY_DN9582_c0_g1_i2.p2 TRINITY_DN9582_c0_g1~~TRINITY_DN9582_c0_g1_i2.p2  ORF type:complete len:632 (+),score=194.35 TRINITY_DN9582_c0_g1_i2:80-1975(+)